MILPKLEICTGDPEGVKAAIVGGADRIELCSGLSEGGLTPSIGMIRYASSHIPTNVLIRPRAGDFVYSQDETDLIIQDIEAAINAGAQGIVVGALTESGKPDINLCKRIIEAAGDADTTFHRAFDMTTDPFEALQTIISLGFKRILTSGQAPNALEGAQLIRRIHENADGRIKIMAGAGVTPDNVIEILKMSQADEIHASARSLLRGKSQTSAASMGSADDGNSRMATDATIVKKLFDKIHIR